MYFCDSSSKPFLLLVLKEQTRCSKDYDSPLGLCTGQIDDFPRVTGLLRIHARLLRPPCFAATEEGKCCPYYIA